jgi:hypothetical protein
MGAAEAQRYYRAGRGNSELRENSGENVSGKPNNVFDPQGNATRTEVASMLHRFHHS